MNYPKKSESVKKEPKIFYSRRILVSYMEKLNGHLQLKINYDGELGQSAKQKATPRTCQHYHYWLWYRIKQEC